MKAIYFVFLSIYLVLGVSSIFNGVNWAIDGFLSAFILTALFLLRKKLKLGLVPFIFVNAALLMHNAGLFGAYSIDWKFFAYDNLLHFFSCAVVGYITLNFLNSKIKSRTYSILLTIAIVLSLGLFIELTEYTGYVLLGEGDGLLMTGIGDYNDMSAYLDTMDDHVSNLIGAIAGVCFYLFRKKFY